MKMTSIWPYPILMIAFIMQGWLLSRVLPFHRQQFRRQSDERRVMSLDGLRGLLALSVFFLHVVEFYQYKNTGLWTPIQSNFYNQLGVFPVSMFFFITGYVFWLKLIDQSRIPFWQFLYGRLGRLGGVYGLTCLICFALAAVVSKFHMLVSTRLLATQVLGWLLFFGSGHDINGIYLSRLWLGPGWTLKYEWMFYFSVPWLGWFARRSQRLLILVGTSVGVSLFGAHLHFSGLLNGLCDLVVSYAKFLAYNFSVGMLVAAVRLPPGIESWARGNLASVLSIALIFGAATWAAPQYGFAESLLLAVPFICVCSGNTWFGLLTSEPVRFLGRISYSFYLIHMVLLTIEFMFLRRYAAFATIGPVRYWLFATASGGLSICVAAISYQYLEYPLLHLGKVARNSSRRLQPQVNDPFTPTAEPAA